MTQWDILRIALRVAKQPQCIVGLTSLTGEGSQSNAHCGLLRLGEKNHASGCVRSGVKCYQIVWINAPVVFYAPLRNRLQDVGSIRCVPRRTFYKLNIDYLLIWPGSESQYFMKLSMRRRVKLMFEDITRCKDHRTILIKNTIINFPYRGLSNGTYNSRHLSIKSPSDEPCSWQC